MLIVLIIFFSFFFLLYKLSSFFFFVYESCFSVLCLKKKIYGKTWKKSPKKFSLSKFSMVVVRMFGGLSRGTQWLLTALNGTYKGAASKKFQCSGVSSFFLLGRSWCGQSHPIKNERCPTLLCVREDLIAPCKRERCWDSLFVYLYVVLKVRDMVRAFHLNKRERRCFFIALPTIT